jgi:hypothetical protein
MSIVERGETAASGTPVRNAGYALSVGEVVLEVRTLDALGNPAPSRAGPFTLVVRMNGVPYNGAAEIAGVSTPVQAGVLRLDSGTSAVLRNVWKGIEFSVRQLPKGEYALDGEDCLTGRVEACRAKTVRFVNRERPLGQLFIAFDGQGQDEHPRILRVRGPSFPAGEERILLPGRTLLLGGLIYGEYRIGELPGGVPAPSPEERVFLSMNQRTGTVRLQPGAAGPLQMPLVLEAVGFLNILTALNRPKK